MGEGEEPPSSPPTTTTTTHLQPPGGTKLSGVRGTPWPDKMLQNDKNDNEFHVSQSYS